MSATPAPTTTPGAGSSGDITWNYPDAASLPAGCSANGTGTTNYTVVAELDPGLPNNSPVTNGVTLSGTPIGTDQPLTTSATRRITAITTSPGNAGNFLGKSAKGPLDIPNFGFDATYAGNWITPINQRPSSNPGSAEGQYTVSVSYPASRAFTTDLADPVPCLDNVSDVVYSSNTPSGAINGPGSIDNLCQHPAFNPTAIQVNSASLAAAIATGFRPIGIRPDGSTFTMAVNGTPGTSTYFNIPAGEVGHIAAIELPPNTSLTDVTMSMSVWGFGEGSLTGGSVMHDIATATAYPVTGGTPTTASKAADIYIEPSAPQLGVFKSFGTRGAAPGGSTALNLTGSISTPAPLDGGVVITDLLPFGLSWRNPSATATFRVTKASGGTAANVTATVEDIQNFNSSGRELIRVTLPAATFVSGFYTITAPTNFIELNVPTGAATYNNTDQLFVKGVADNTSPQCGPGTTTTGATFESSDALDLDGDGATNENYCQWAASLTVPPSGGPAFTLVKTVQGDQDPAPKFSPGIGNAAQGGTGVYNLTWSNTGGRPLNNPVIYDILPHIGDTGVSQNQSTVQRDSQFAPVFSGLSGTLPTGVTAAYSTSLNPCRPEVLANLANPTCVDDWSLTPPADLSTVTAVRFTASGTYQPAQQFTVGVLVAVPPQFVNIVAWNSAASDATTTAGVPLLPAEPPKVGLTAPAPPLTPTVTTKASETDVLPGGSVADTITVGNTGGATGALDWRLVGPVTPGAGRSCANLDWSTAATFDSGSIQVTGDGDHTTPASTPTDPGCYSYVATVNGTAFEGPGDSPAGSDGEVVLVAPPELSTEVSSDSVQTRSSIHDTLTVVGTTGHGGSISWELLGPIVANSSGTCTGLDWSDAATLRDGTISVTGDGDLNTPDETLDAAGCYGYTATLTGADYGGNPISSEAGTPGEVVQVKAPPPPPLPPPPPGPPNPPRAPAPPAPSQTPSSWVTIVKHVNDAKVTLGKPLTYTLTVSNRGPDTATGVAVTDTPSAKMKILSVRTASGICTSGLPLTCHLKPIDDGGRATITVKAVPLTAGAVVNHAHVTSQDHNAAPRRDVFAAASTRVMVPLKLTKTASARTVDAGATVSFRVAVANPTNVTARSAQVCDKLPAGLALVSASVRTRLHHGSLCWTIASIAPHGRRTYSMTVRALQGASGNRVNTVTVSGPAVAVRHARASVRILPAVVLVPPVTG